MKKLLNKIHEKNQNRKWDIKLITGLSVIIFGILYCTISPTIAGGDSGELVAEGDLSSLNIKINFNYNYN